ncbi:MAG: hypothetical protein K6C94_00670 [Candidatus Gastranaerophilales bacterium]|nr:hypothetical protein [Candidatus Gastranaerophilales bacterium]
MSEFNINNQVRGAENLERLKKAAENLQQSESANNPKPSIFKGNGISALQNLSSDALINLLNQTNNANKPQISEQSADNAETDNTINDDALLEYINKNGMGSEEDIDNLIKDVNGILGSGAAELVLPDVDFSFWNSDYEKFLNDAMSIRINGVLDTDVQQEGTPDCYFLATLNSLGQTENGKQIIKDAISYDPETAIFTVTFKGVGESYSFTTPEVKEAEDKRYDSLDANGNRVVGDGSSWYSNGDDDAMLLEMAFEKFRKDVSDGKFDDRVYVDENMPSFMLYTGAYDGTDATSPLDYGSLDQVIYAFTGQEPETVYSPDDTNVLHDELTKIQERMQNGEEFVVQASIAGSNGYTEDENGNYYVNDDGRFVKITKGSAVPEDATRYSFNGIGDNTNGITLDGVGKDNGETIRITTNGTGGHAISITAVSDTTVTIINPWDSAQKIKVSRAEFESYMHQVSYLSLGEKADS